MNYLRVNTDVKLCDNLMNIFNKNTKYDILIDSHEYSPIA